MAGIHLCSGRPRTCWGLVPDHRNIVNSTIKRVTEMLWFSSAYKSLVYTVLLSTECVVGWVRSGRCVLWAHSLSLHTQSVFHAHTKSDAGRGLLGQALFKQLGGF